MSSVFFVNIGGTEDNVLFREPNISFLPDLSQAKKVPRVISILVEISPFFYVWPLYLAEYFFKRLLIPRLLRSGRRRTTYFLVQDGS